MPDLTVVPPAAALSQDSPRTFTYTLPAKPTSADVISFMKAVGKFIGLATADFLCAEVFSAGHSGCMALLNAAGTLETTAGQWQNFEIQKNMPQGQGGPGGQGLPGPFRMN